MRFSEFCARMRCFPTLWISDRHNYSCLFRRGSCSNCLIRAGFVLTFPCIFCVWVVGVGFFLCVCWEANLTAFMSVLVQVWLWTFVPGWKCMSKQLQMHLFVVWVGWNKAHQEAVGYQFDSSHDMIIIFIIIIIFDKRIYINLFKSTQSAAELKDLKPAVNGRYLMCKSLPYYLHLLYRNTFILLSRVSKVHAGSFYVSIIHQTLTWTVGSLTCSWSFLYVHIHTHKYQDTYTSTPFWGLTIIYCYYI